MNIHRTIPLTVLLPLAAGVALVACSTPADPPHAVEASFDNTSSADGGAPLDASADVEAATGDATDAGVFRGAEFEAPDGLRVRLSLATENGETFSRVTLTRGAHSASFDDCGLNQSRGVGDVIAMRQFRMTGISCMRASTAQPLYKIYVFFETRNGNTKLQVRRSSSFDLDEPGVGDDFRMIVGPAHVAERQGLPPYEPPLAVVSDPNDPTHNPLALLARAMDASVAVLDKRILPAFWQGAIDGTVVVNQVSMVVKSPHRGTTFLEFGNPNQHTGLSTEAKGIVGHQQDVSLGEDDGSLATAATIEERIRTAFKLD